MVTSYEGRERGDLDRIRLRFIRGLSVEMRRSVTVVARSSFATHLSQEPNIK